MTNSANTPNPELTPEFNDVEHIQSICRLVVNDFVKDDFSDVNLELPDTDITTTRSSLRKGCLHKDGDSLLLTVARLLTYYLVVDKARKLQAPVYGTRESDVTEDLSFRPIVHFYFEQDYQAVPPGFPPLQAEWRFRLVHETSDTINEIKATQLAKAIKRVFGLNGMGYTVQKGKVKCTYLDKSKGYDFRINAISETEAELLIKRFLEIQGDTFNDDFFTPHNPRKKSINNPTGTRKVYGKTKRNKRWRPTGTVRFRYASLQVDGEASDIMLVDLRDRSLRPLA